MLIVTVELKRPGESRTEKIGLMHITNDGTGTKTRGNYEVILSAAPTPAQILKGRCGPEYTLEYQVGIKSYLKGFERKKDCWRLVQAVLNNFFTKAKG